MVHRKDRHLKVRRGRYYYQRRVPTRVAGFDDRAPLICESLHTDDLVIARFRRDAQEEADELHWSQLLGNGNEINKLNIARKRSEALGFPYLPLDELVRDPKELQRRTDALLDRKAPPSDRVAVLGGVDPQSLPLSSALDLYIKEIAAADLIGKSPKQRADWEKVKRRAVNNFIEEVGDKPLVEITRGDARQFFGVWRDRITGEDGLSPNSGNRDIGNMRVLFAKWALHFDLRDMQNPFADLRFEEKFKKSRPPIPVNWIKDTIMAPGAMSTLNDDARRIVLTMIETGARPSEICNLRPRQIRLDDEVPHLSIDALSEKDEKRQIKTTSSIRKIPLVGVALEAMKRSPEGFPRYHDKETSLSGTLMKFFKENGLFPSDKHSIYSLRHSFEDRMKEAGLDTELRRSLMGHSNDRPKYGEGGELKWRRDELLKVALAYDPRIV